MKLAGSSRIKNKDVNIIAMSFLLTTSMGAMKDVLEELNKQCLLHGVKTMVGGPLLQKSSPGQ